MGIRQIFTNFWRDERGQSTTEYILILAVIVMIAVKFKGELWNKVQGMINKFGEQADKAMEPIQ